MKVTVIALDALKSMISTASADAVHEWHALVIDAVHEVYREKMMKPSQYNNNRYEQLLDLELAIINRGRTLRIYPPINE